jgi:hypothetical protein
MIGELGTCLALDKTSLSSGGAVYLRGGEEALEDAIGVLEFYEP